MSEDGRDDLRKRLKKTYHLWRYRIRKNLPFGLRSLVGLLLVVGGVFGFLPVLGFWMIPLGIAVILIDVRAFRKWRARRRKGR